MSAEVLSRILHDPKYPSFVVRVERLLRRARNLHLLGATRQTVQEYLRSEQAYTLLKPAYRLFTRNTPM